MKIIVAILAILMIATVAQADVTFKVVEGEAIITEVRTNQPVPIQGQNGQVVALPGAKSDITTTYAPLSKEDTQIQLIQANKMKMNITNKYNQDIVNIDAKIKLLKDIDTALPK